MAVNNDKVDGLVLFTVINKQGSLSAAAQLLGMSRSSVSKQLAALEQRVGARLLKRTTRKIMLTDVGRQVLKEALKVEQAMQAIEHISEDYQLEIAGTLKVSCSSAQGRKHLVPLISRFLLRYPKIKINLQLEDRFVDMVSESIDVSIRIGFLPDSSLIARRLGDLSWTLCASPAYLEQAPPLKHPRDLLNHNCIYYRNAKTSMNTWTFLNDSGEETVVVDGSFTINDASALVSAATQNMGILLIDKSLLGDTINKGVLVPVLRDYKPIGGLPMYAIYPEKEYMPAKTKAFIDFLVAEMPAVIS
ncbi:LysR family transcriptional regulator [Reinekea sp.]|jgi:LysR family transcriptional activator of dmlA|uniref:LysR family transcriptional regulator n=1 Tax=Reinekea sp. TaxID=1970455 RepID=UPI00398984F9